MAASHARQLLDTPRRCPPGRHRSANSCASAHGAQVSEHVARTRSTPAHGCAPGGRDGSECANDSSSRGRSSPRAVVAEYTSLDWPRPAGVQQRLAHQSALAPMSELGYAGRRDPVPRLGAVLEGHDVRHARHAAPAGRPRRRAGHERAPAAEDPGARHDVRRRESDAAQLFELFAPEVQLSDDVGFGMHARVLVRGARARARGSRPVRGDAPPRLRRPRSPARPPAFRRAARVGLDKAAYTVRPPQIPDARVGRQGYVADAPSLEDAVAHDDRRAFEHEPGLTARRARATRACTRGVRSAAGDGSAGRAAQRNTRTRTRSPPPRQRNRPRRPRLAGAAGVAHRGGRVDC